MSREKITPGTFNESDRRVGMFASVRAAGIPMATNYPYQNGGSDYNPFRGNRVSYKGDDLSDPFFDQEWLLVINALNEQINHLEKYRGSLLKWNSISKGSGEDACLEGTIELFKEISSQMSKSAKDPEKATKENFEKFCKEIKSGCEVALNVKGNTEVHSYFDKLLKFFTELFTKSCYTTKSEDTLRAIEMQVESSTRPRGVFK